LLAGFVVVLMTAAIVGLFVFFNSDADAVPALFAKMTEVIVNSRATMPSWLAMQIPLHPEDLKDAVRDWLHVHSEAVQLTGRGAARALLYVLVGMVIGAMIALHESSPARPHRALACALIERVAKFASSFRRMVFAQMQIALLNALFTGIYLGILLPLFGVDLPLKKTLVAVTFITGLLPIVGNLISNMVVVIVSLSYSGHVAIGSLVFLIVIHKMEYFLNARIVGNRINARAWELLVAMLAMEAAFGIYGVIAAPLYYAYVKDELAERGVI
jgi:predicted PurR-regulated permease PerM